jgi:hypothetical protein
MYRDTFLDNIILQSILDTRRSNKEKLFPVKYRITQNRKQVLYSSGIYCSVEDWKLITIPDEKGIYKRKDTSNEQFYTTDDKIYTISKKKV